MGLLAKILQNTPQDIRWPVPREGEILFLYNPPAGILSSRTQISIRPGERAVLITEEEPATIYGPGRRTLGPPQLAGLSIRDAFPGKVLFVRTSPFTQLNWELSEAFTFRDTEYGQTGIQAKGKASLRISQPALFYSNLLQPEALLSPKAKTLSVKSLLPLLGELMQSQIEEALHRASNRGRTLTLADISLNYDEFSQWLKIRVEPFFHNLGFQITGLTLKQLTLPAAVEEDLQKRSAGGLASLPSESAAEAGPPVGSPMARKMAEAFSRK